MSAGLAVLPPSPPTTTTRKHASPKHDSEDSRVIGNIKGIHTLKEPSLDTPDESPASFPGSGSGSGKNRKRVEFSPWTNIHNAPVFTTSSPSNVSVRPLLPSRELSSSASILKPSSQLDVTPQGAEDELQPRVSLVDMLESITQQLSRNEVAESTDAYHTLSCTLKAYSEVPDSQAFKSKLGPLMQHIRRDLEVLEKCEYGPAEINLTTQTLKVLATLAWHRNFSILLSNDIQGYVLDRAIHVVEEHKIPKGVLLHYLHLLSTQDFRHSIVGSSGRVGRLLDALKDLTQHVRGNGIVSERLLVYHRLLEQARSHMKAKPLSWIHELLDGLTCPHKETRTKAIALGTKAAAVFPSSSTVSHALRTVLDMKLDEGKTVGIFACKRLEKMLANKDDGLVVPQIWAIVLSLMKGIEGGIGKWASLKEWLKVIQRCFNSSHSAIRSQANLAWNRFVYVVSPSEVNESLLGVLIKPISVQMEQKGLEREDRSSRATAFSAYCNLLYYCFRPSASHKQYDRVWEEYVVKVMTSSFFEKSPAAADRVCRIFMALFWNGNSKSKLWREIRAQENVLMEPEELPTIDCRWIRSKSLSILKIFKLLFKNSSWGSEDRPDQSFVATGWKHFSKALGAACCKEMKPSVETMQALTNTLSFLRDIWKTGPSALNAVENNVKDAFMIRFRFVCLNVLTETGAIPLIEGRLTADFAKGRMDTITSHGSSPIIQFLSTLSSVSEDIIPSQAYGEFVKDILLLPRKGRIQSRLRIRLLRQSAVSVLVESSQTLTESAAPYIWQAIASAVQEEFDSCDTILGLKADIDNVLDDVVRILEIGVTYSPDSTTLWCGLLDSLIGFARQGEPEDVANVSNIARSLTSCIENVPSCSLTVELAELIKCVLPCIELLVARTFPRQPRGKPRSKTTVVISPLFNKLLFLLNFHLNQAYTTLSAESLLGISGIVDATCQSLRSCPSEVLVHCLKVLETSLCLWLQDNHRLLTATTPVGAAKLIAGRKMSSLLIDIFGKSFERENDFAQLGSLLAAGFQSSHKLTVNQMIQMWNSTFGTQKQLTYPPVLKAALERLQPFVDIELPGFSIHTGNLDIADRPTFLDSQDEHAAGLPRSTEVSDDESKSAKQRRLQSPLPWNGRASSSRSLQIAQTAKERRSVAISTTRKPRHDDSQVQYVAIESSPLKDAGNESQYLTDRQKEVRCRQQVEPAVVFRDLQTSPLPGSVLLHPMRKSNLSIDLTQAERFEDERPATPTLPVLLGEGVEEEMASSPTPQSKQPVLRLDDIEVPSSPPSMPGCGEVHAPPELISNLMDIMQNGAFNHQTGSPSTPPRSYSGDELPEAQTGGYHSPAPEHPEQLDASDLNNVHNDRVLTNVALNGHLQGRGGLVNIARKSVELDVPLVSPAAPDKTESFVGHASGENPGQLNLENAQAGAVVERVESSQERPSKHLAIPLEEEMQSEHVRQSSGLEDSLHEEKQKEPDSPSESIQNHLEMAGVSPPRHSDPGQSEAGNQKEEDWSMDGNVCNSPISDFRPILEREAANPAISNSCCVINRRSSAVSHHSHADSDEVDMLSASQLSQDLDWHVAFEQRAPEIDKSLEAEALPSIRKRKRSAGYLPSPKRRKSSCSVSDLGRQHLAQSSGTHGQAKQAEEVFDCIVLDTTPQPQRAANQSSQLFSDAMNTKQGRRKRGRKPKQSICTFQGQLSSIVDSGSSSPPEVDFKVEAMPLEDEGRSEKEAPVTFPGLGQTFSSSTAPSSALESNDRRTPTEGATTGLPQPPVTHAIPNNCSVAITGLDTTATPGKALDEPFESPGVPNLLSASEPVHAQTAGDVQEAEPGPDMVEHAACTPAQQAYLLSQTKRPQDGPDTQANRPLQFGKPEGLGATMPSVTEAGGEVDVIGSLQQVLEQLKSAKMERIALRELEDLLFEIRTEAQYAVARQVAG